jgi:hypothetical protein
MRFNPIRFPAHTAKIFLVAGLLSFGSVAGAQSDEASSSVDLTPITSRGYTGTLPENPDRHEAYLVRSHIFVRKDFGAALPLERIV